MKFRTMEPKARLLQDKAVVAPLQRTANLASQPYFDADSAPVQAPCLSTGGHSFANISVVSQHPATISPTSLSIQAKLKVNEPGDKYEQEADMVAEEVTRMPDPRLQRQCDSTSSGGGCDECKKRREELLSGAKGVQRQGVHSKKPQQQPPKKHAAAPKKLIRIDLATQTLVATEDGKEAFHFNVVSGSSGHETPLSPPGRPFHVTRKAEHYRSKKYDAPMEHSLFFVESEGIAIHESYAVGLRSLVRSAGISAVGSHGCVGLSADDAAKLFDWTPKGTPVEVVNSELQAPTSPHTAAPPAQTGPVHRKETSPVVGGFDASPSVHAVLNTPGQPLDQATRDFFELRFGHDFSHVRIHSDTVAAKSAHDVSARAYTVRNHIAFASGEASDLGLMAHELTHVIQQNDVVCRLPDGGGTAAASLADEHTECNEPTSSPSANYITHIPFAIGSSTLDSNALSKIKHLVETWNAQGQPSPLRIDGYASTVGSAARNKVLSCLRAKAVAAALGTPFAPRPLRLTDNQTTPLRVSNNQMTLFAHGETSAFSQEQAGANQIATIMHPLLKPCAPAVPGSEERICGDPSNQAGPPNEPCTPFESLEQALSAQRGVKALFLPLVQVCTPVATAFAHYLDGIPTFFRFTQRGCVTDDARAQSQASEEFKKSSEDAMKKLSERIPVLLRQIPLDALAHGFPVVMTQPLHLALGIDAGEPMLHPRIEFKGFNPTGLMAGGVGSSDIYGDDDRSLSGLVELQIDGHDPVTSEYFGTAAIKPHLEVMDTIDFCPGNLGGVWRFGISIAQMITVPMSKLEAHGLAKDIPFEIGFDFDELRQSFRSVR